MRVWKGLGLAAFAGVAATGVVIARAERRRRAYTPQEIRERLQTRLAETPRARDAGPGDAGPGDAGPGDAGSGDAGSGLLLILMCLGVITAGAGRGP